MIGARHLSNDDILDLAEQRGGPRAHAHAAACASCGSRVEALRASLADARDADVPDPSPLFWEHLSARVSAAIDSEPQDRPSPAPAFLRRPAWLAAGGVLAAMALVVAFVVRTSPVAPEPPRAAREAPVAVAVPAGDTATADEVATDEPWALVAALSEDVSPDAAPSEGLDPSPGSAERAAETLSAGERSELVRLLEAELARRPL